MENGRNAHRPVTTAAIFGASGAIGRALAKALIERGVRVWAGSRRGNTAGISGVGSFQFDLTDEASIKAAADVMRSDPPQLVIAATGMLTLENGITPERTIRKLDPAVMAEIFCLNSIGPALIAKHMVPVLPRKSRAIFAALSARVGSITDNSLGGWHSYRASKAALNMILKNLAIEVGRTHHDMIVAGLHPGTVDSALSQPFQGNLPEGQLTDPALSAANLLNVLDGLTPSDSGGVFAYDGKPIPA